MQERSNPPPLQTFSQEEPASSSIDNASVLPSNMASHTCEESTLGLSSAAIQLLLLVIILYAAHIQYPQLHPGFLVACGAAFVLLFIRKSWVSGFPCQACNVCIRGQLIMLPLCNRQQKGIKVMEYLQETLRHSNRHGKILFSPGRPILRVCGSR